MKRQFALFLAIAAFSGFLSVAFGAFGAHGLKTVLTAQQLVTWETAVRYQMWHAFALALVSILAERFPSDRLLTLSGWLFFGGSLLFSGSLYLLCLSGPKWLGPITPVGGLLLLAGWLALLTFAIKRFRHA